MENRIINLTPDAQKKAIELLSRESRDDLMLRVAVSPGGCSGLIYDLFFDSRISEDDSIEEYEGVEVVVDAMSTPYIEGSTIDYTDTIERQGFTLDNPNAADSCACGSSFS
jgi:iron-sulfur cluster assembly accessory protein